MKSKILENKGFTGIETAVALIILMIFISLISVIFTNVYLSFTDNKRNSEATAYATQIVEMIDKMYYADVTNEKIAKKVLEMNIPKSYNIGIQIDNYKNGDSNNEDLVKNVVITVKYQVGKQERNVEFKTVKAKEILITPNKPTLEKDMIPVKYVITDRDTNSGYWVISAEDDPSWYSYENKRWASVAMQNGLTIEGGIAVTDENKNNIVGKKVETMGNMYVWIPRFAYKDKNITFLYSTSNSYVNEEGNLEDIKEKEGYQTHEVFQTQKGIWYEKYNSIQSAENALNNNSSDNILSAVKILINSNYGDISNLVILTNGKYM